MTRSFQIRKAKKEEYKVIGQLMVRVYSQLEGFPSPIEQPRYYKLLASIGLIADKPKAQILIAVDSNDSLAGAVVYFGDMQHYGSGGTATQEKNAAGFRLLAVDPEFRGNSLGKVLTNACIDLAKEEGHEHLIIHTTDAMKTAWGMYERIGFKRALDLDFLQEDFPVYGFRLKLKDNE